MDIRNKLWQKFIRKGDKALMCLEPEQRFCAWCTVFFSLFFLYFFGILGTVLGMFFGIAAGTTVGTIIGVVVAVLLFVLTVISIYLHYRSKKYVLSDKGIYVISGWLLKSVHFVAYNQIVDVELKRGVSDMLSGAGCVLVDTASGNVVNGTSTAELSVAGIADYEEIYEFILGRVK